MSDGYELIITEKPRACQRIAEALGTDNITPEKTGKVTYFKIQRGGKQIVVAPAVGHVFTLKAKKGEKGFPIFNIEWVPSHEAVKSAAFTKAYVNVIKKLTKNATSFVNACDFDIEGSLIGYNVLKYICGDESAEKATRMKFSSLTKEELEKSYDNKFEHLDFPMVNAGIARHIMDYYWGINTSRALSSAYQEVSGHYLTLSAGRVQTPTLKLLDDREKEIKKFKPEDYWVILANLFAKDTEIEATHEKGDIFDKKTAEKIFEKCKDKPAKIAEIHKSETKHNPPNPFNLGDLQSEAYRLFKYTPKRTQQIAQTLYEQGLISYPRTSSQKLPAGVKPKEMLEKIAKIPGYKELADKVLSQKELKPNEGKKTDSAHPCIYPTGEIPKGLEDSDKNMFDVIVKRFLAIFGEPAVRENQTVTFNISDEKFLSKGSRTVEKNWHELYAPYVKLEEKEFPALEQGEDAEVKTLDLLDKETKPPGRYSPASIVKKMENIGIGTKATRANILQTLYDRNYVIGTKLQVTEFGSMIVETLEEYAEDLTSEKLTREFEEKVEKIQEGDQNKEEVLEEAKVTLNKIMDGFKEHSKEIGEKISKQYSVTRKEQRTIGKCPVCKDGDLIIRVSKASRKQFIGCSAYPKCDCSYPLPQQAKIVNSGKLCEHDQLPIIEVIRRGKRKFAMCIDPKCKSKEDWGKDKKEKNKDKK